MRRFALMALLTLLATALAQQPDLKLTADLHAKNQADRARRMAEHFALVAEACRDDKPFLLEAERHIAAHRREFPASMVFVPAPPPVNGPTEEYEDDLRLALLLEQRDQAKKPAKEGATSRDVFPTGSGYDSSPTYASRNYRYDGGVGYGGYRPGGGYGYSYADTGTSRSAGSSRSHSGRTSSSISAGRGGNSYGDQGGHYAGGVGSSHKGGHYQNSRTNNHYQNYGHRRHR